MSTLLERINARLCAAPGCRRDPAYPDQKFCREHRVRWVPEWQKHLTAKDMTRAA